MSADFVSKPILNSPYAYPSRHWELDEQGQPTQKIIETRRPPAFVTPIPKPKKRKSSEKQSSIVFDEGNGTLYTRTAVRRHSHHQRRTGGQIELMTFGIKPGRTIEQIIDYKTLPATDKQLD